jgi:hypothetical protein
MILRQKSTAANDFHANSTGLALADYEAAGLYVSVLEQMSDQNHGGA